MISKIKVLLSLLSKIGYCTKIRIAQFVLIVIAVLCYLTL